MNIKEFIIKASTKNFDIRIWKQYTEDLPVLEENTNMLSFVHDLWNEEDMESVAQKILDCANVNAVEVVPNWYKYNACAIGTVYYKDWP